MHGGERASYSKWAAAFLIGLIAIAPAAACSDDSAPQASQESPSGTVAEPRTEDQTRDELVDSGVEDNDIDCATARTDATVTIDNATTDSLHQRCEAARQFAESVADNIEAITENQRTCLAEKLVALPPETITSFYTDALRPDNRDPSKPDQLATILTNCGIQS